MVIAECHRIILKSESAGNSEDGSHNSAIIFFEYIPFPKALAILVFQTRVLADGGWIDFYRSDGDAAVIVRCLVNEGPTLIFE